ncbi:DNA-binding response regulator [bacterium]|nr:DNA-binding response regulator [bacterium]
MKILVIEDDYAVRETLCSLLNFNGFSSISSANGAEAIHYLERCRQEQKPYPKLIILDLNMPIMDGYEFLSLKKGKNWKDIPLLIMSAQEDLDPEIGLHIKKPFEIQILLNNIENLLQIKK